MARRKTSNSDERYSAYLRYLGGLSWDELDNEQYTLTHEREYLGEMFSDITPDDRLLAVSDAKVDKYHAERA